MLCTSLAAWVSGLFASIGVCLKSDTKPANSLLVHGQPGARTSLDKSTVSDSFWTSSTNDIDTPASLVGFTIATGHSGFLNHGLQLWNQIRMDWNRGKRQSNDDRRPLGLGHRIGIYTTYESLLGSNRPFRRPIPLSEMVEFLVEVWDEEGLYE